MIEGGTLVGADGGRELLGGNRKCACFRVFCGRK